MTPSKKSFAIADEEKRQARELEDLRHQGGQMKRVQEIEESRNKIKAPDEEPDSKQFITLEELSKNRAQQISEIEANIQLPPSAAVSNAYTMFPAACKALIDYFKPEYDKGIGFYQLPLSYASDLIHEIVGHEIKKHNSTRDKWAPRWDGNQFPAMIPAIIFSSMVPLVCISANINDPSNQEDSEIFARYNYPYDPITGRPTPRDRVGIYTEFTRDDERKLLSIFGINVSPVAIATLDNELRARSVEVSETQDKNLVLVGNGIWHRDTHTLTPFTPDVVSTSKIVTDYIDLSDKEEPKFTFKDGHTMTVREFIDLLACGDEVKSEALWDIIHMALMPLDRIGKVPLLYDERGSNGKSTYLQLIRAVVGEGACASVDLQTMTSTRDTFGLEQLIGKSVNLADEGDSTYIPYSGDFKRITTGEPISVNRKNKSRVKYTPRITNIIATNSFPNFKDKTNALKRRLYIVAMSAHFSKEEGNVDKRVKDEWVNSKDVREWVLWYTLTQLADFESLPDLPDSDYIDSEFECETDNVAAFLMDFFDNNPENNRITTYTLYIIYQAWMERVNGGGKPVSRKTFVHRLRDWLERNHKGWHMPQAESGHRSARVRQNQVANLPDEYVAALLKCLQNGKINKADPLWQAYVTKVNCTILTPYIERDEPVRDERQENLVILANRTVATMNQQTVDMLAVAGVSADEAKSKLDGLYALNTVRLEGIAPTARDYENFQEYLQKFVEAYA